MLWDHQAHLSYLRSVANIKQAWHGESPFQHTNQEVAGSNLVAGKNFFWQKNLIAHVLHAHANFPFSLPFNAWCNLDATIVLLLFHLESWSKLYVVRRIGTYGLSNLSALSHTHKPGQGNFSDWACFAGFKNSNNIYCQLLRQLCPHHALIFWRPG